ncbi:MAG TPA: hypothetical protein VG651_15315 [Stellaceae bacterium]|nr:hypothetical protein [Stellaceae bacterium]
MNPSPSHFELVASELRILGITLRRLPGEYCVNYRNGGDRTARMADDLDQALKLGRAMAADAKSSAMLAKKSPRRRWRRRKMTLKARRRWRPRKMTPKAQRRRLILRHNRQLRSRTVRKPRRER